MTTPVHDHSDRAVLKFLDQFKRKPKLEGMLRSYTDRIQELEDACWEVMLYRSIASGFGVILDRIGRIVGRGRGALNDSNYRIALRAQVRINRSSGATKDILDVARLSLPAGFTVQFFESFPAQIQIVINQAVTWDVLTFFRNLVLTKMGGVRLLLEYSDQSDVFAWSTTSAMMTGQADGLGDSANASTGGVLATVLASEITT